MQELNFDKWVPQESEREMILKDLYNNYEATLEICGLGEESDEAMELYQNVKFDGLTASRDAVQEHYAEAYHVVNGQIDKIYGKDDPTTKLIQLTVCPEAKILEFRGKEK